MNLMNCAIVGLVLVNQTALKPHPEVNNSDATTNPSQIAPSLVELQRVHVVSLPKRDWIDMSALGISALLALFAGAGVVVAIKTLNKIERQTKATEAAVKATESAVKVTEESVKAQTKTTQAYMNVERPFILISVSGNVDSLTITASNRGKTPARILFIDPMLKWDYIPYDGHLPPAPDYTNRGIPIENLDTINFPWILPDDPGYTYPAFNARTLIEADPERASAIKNFLVTFYVYSAIRYVGLVGVDVYETRFCYKLNMGEFILGGPYGYNKNT